MSKKDSKIWSYNECGEFTANDARAFPQPMIHMLANGPKYFSICDNFLRGFSGFDYTRMFGEFDGPNFPKGQARFLWIRSKNAKPWLVNNYDLTNKESVQPKYEMGLGYTRFSAKSNKLKLSVSATVFVPLDDTAEIWIVEIQNNSSKSQSLDFIPTVPIFGGNRDYVEYHRDVVRLYNKSRITNRIEILPGLEWIEGSTDASGICYFMGSETQKGKKGNRFYSDRETFLGANNMWLKPQAILNNEPPKTQCYGKEAVGAIEFKNIVIPAGKSEKFVVITGISFEASSGTEKILKKYNYSNAVKAFENLKLFWKERTSRVVINTGDKDFNTLWNNWWCYQLSMRYWFGNTGHPQTDYGSDFSGWRDFWQDMMAATVIDPKGLQERTVKTLEGIRLDGTNATRFFARTKEFGSDELHGLWCDHPYWTAQTVMILANFLGDYDFLFRDGISYFKDSYRSRGEVKDLDWKAGVIDSQKTQDNEIYRGSVIEHILTQLLTMFYDVGAAGLLKQKRADWNDAVDQVKGENVTFTFGLALDCKELADLLEKVCVKKNIAEIEIFEELSFLINNNDAAAAAEERRDRLVKYLDKVNRNISGKKVKIRISDIVADLRNKAEISIKNANRKAWNGNYYSGYIFDNGNPVDTIFKAGALSKKKPTADDFEMMLMPQTWSLVSGAADNQNCADKVIDSVLKFLFDKKSGALKLNYPPYLKFDKNIGRITGFAAGTKENNAIFCHANLFFIWALLRRNRADEAYKIFSGINPLTHPQNIFRSGPWIPEYYVSSDNPNIAGRGEYPILTGSAAWTRYLFQNFFFGVRGELDGLRIDPKLPANKYFKECSLQIKFRGARYDIKFLNKKLVKNSKVLKIIVDDKEIEGTLISPFAGGIHKVEVILG
jgi:cellobiose phosphorylase